MVCGKSTTQIDDYDILFTTKFNNTKKLLLLGTGESGKTTIIKQMKILHINGFSNDERKEKIPQIRQNVHESIYDIVNNMNKIDPPVEIENEESRKSIEYILNIGPKEPSEYTDEYFDHLKVAWADGGVKKTFKRSNEYQLIDSAEHFLNGLETIRKPDYIPTIQDILFCRVMTVTISKIEFKMPIPKKFGGGMAEFCMYDVGGQRGQRRKWIQVFEGLQAILFLIAASDFDLTLREDPNVNRLEESFNLFKDMYSSKYLRDAGLIVFLNKQDILKRKIEEGKRLDKYFPEYSSYKCNEKEECNNEYDRAKLFMRQKINDIAETPVVVEDIGFVPGKNVHEVLPPRDVFIHFTTATDTNNIKKVFDSVHDIILSGAIKDVFY